MMPINSRLMNNNKFFLIYQAWKDISFFCKSWMGKQVETKSYKIDRTPLDILIQALFSDKLSDKTNINCATFMQHQQQKNKNKRYIKLLLA